MKQMLGTQCDGSGLSEPHHSASQFAVACYFRYTQHPGFTGRACSAIAKFDYLHEFIALALTSLLVWGAPANAAPSGKDAPFLTEAESISCMGDDRSRKQTEEVARDEAKRHAAEQAATQVRSQSKVSLSTLEEDVIKLVSSGKVRVLEVLASQWDKEGCYTYRIRAEVVPSKPGEFQSLANRDEALLWDELEDQPDLSGVDSFLHRFPLSIQGNNARAMQAELEMNYKREIGSYLVYRDTPLHLRPSANSIRISDAMAGDILNVTKVHDTTWAAIQRDQGLLYASFSNLRPLTKGEAEAWQRCQKSSKEVQPLQQFLQTFPRSHLARLAKDRIERMQNRLAREEGLSTQDSEEIALWNRCLKTRDLHCAREYRRRYPNGKFEKESWQIR